jgi:hypothetical protein
VDCGHYAAHIFEFEEARLRLVLPGQAAHDLVIEAREINAAGRSDRSCPARCEDRASLLDVASCI